MTLSPLPVGFLPLVDAAPLIVAAEMGFDHAEGFALDLRRATSWSGLRDMVSFGQVMAAQMLSPMPVAAALGLGGVSVGLSAISVLSTNGEVIGVSSRIADQLRAIPNALAFNDAAAAGAALISIAGGPLRMGVPFPFSMHAELLYYWLSSLGLPAPSGLDIRTVPPPLMAAAMASGEIDAFCVGEPWGSIAVEQNAGELLLPGCAIWPGAPEKILGVRTDLVETIAEQLSALVRAVWHAGQWLDDPRNHTVACEILSSRTYLDVPSEIIDRSLTGHLLTSARGGSHVVRDFVGFSQTMPEERHAAWMAGRLAGRLGLDKTAAVPAGRVRFAAAFHRNAVQAIPEHQPQSPRLDRFFDGRDLDIDLGD
ncbi:NitT/TauT family transport system ATP-binding protein [Jannaschia faecimaris]|uniref:NitT/TauT family transport system ATP-binding protein n=1 Tax=Jannaschia faecimaris TaxID=1244108 RepID=A0A1H3UB42_9RHOB|nr:CmpA/NrtA family ABC transporter substrate-binding protein [Jannaschia faecimaris]SDZ59652.1 NitT/TauT family transport system ATP-binding protein [Jannaschia faecimaris]